MRRSSAAVPGPVPVPVEPPLPPLPVLEFGRVPPAQQPALQHVARTVLKAKRVAVVCGAGISTATGIPDFRSGAGLFESLKKQYPDARLSSGKDLFDVGLFQSEQNAAIFYNMIAELKKQADAVQPTAFHSWLKQLDDDGKLFRVYTQNIDALEEKAGLTYGLGDKSLPLPPRRAPRSPSKQSGSTTPASAPLVPSSSQISVASTASTFYPSPRSSHSPPPTHSTIPRVIPLHGHLGTLSCSACKLVTPTSPYLDLLAAGSAPLCPSCLQKEALRSAAGERARGVGVLRPDVVLYGEEHKDGERVGEITQRDLMGARPDLLIVVGTTLKVKGTKRLVRELAKVIKPSAPRVADRPGRQAPVHAIYLNAEFPAPAKEWAEVFDVWMRGDIQEFVAAVARERGVMEREQGERDGRKRRREEVARAKAAAAAGGAPVSPAKGKGRAPPSDRTGARAGAAGEKENALGCGTVPAEKGKARASPPSPVPSPASKRTRTTPALPLSGSGPPSRPPSARAPQHFTLEIPVPTSRPPSRIVPTPPQLLSLPPLPALNKPIPARLPRASSESSLSSLSDSGDEAESPESAIAARGMSTCSSGSGTGAGTRRSSRASTTSATSASLSAAAAAGKKRAGGGAGGGRTAQTRLGFAVTKKGVGAVTGTKRR